VLMGGLSWQPDGSGIIYSSGRESTAIYLPTMHLWAASLNGSPARQMTYGDRRITPMWTAKGVSSPAVCECNMTFGNFR
jgi:Tol biopolymer transport system component